jgi:hypothetical protein
LTKIECETTLDDYIAFNLFHLKNSKTFKRKKYIYLIVLPTVVGTIMALLAGFSGESPIVIATPYVIIIFFFNAIIFFFLLPILTKRNVTNFLKEGENKGILGKHILLFTHQEIIDTTEQGVSKFAWKTINKIISNEKYIFIYMSAVSAYIIPKKIFDNDSAINDFMKLLDDFKLGKFTKEDIEKTKTPQIFISYAREDEESARRLFYDLL